MKVENFKVGTIYLLKSPFKFEFLFLYNGLEHTRSDYILVPLACSIIKLEEFYGYGYDGCFKNLIRVSKMTIERSKIREVPKKDLPLYVGWAKTWPSLAEELKKL